MKRLADKIQKHYALSVKLWLAATILCWTLPFMKYRSFPYTFYWLLGDSLQDFRWEIGSYIFLLALLPWI
jgi:hypothetical protein